MVPSLHCPSCPVRSQCYPFSTSPHCLSTSVQASASLPSATIIAFWLLGLQAHLSTIQPLYSYQPWSCHIYVQKPPMAPHSSRIKSNLHMAFKALHTHHEANFSSTQVKIQQVSDSQPHLTLCCLYPAIWGDQSPIPWAPLLCVNIIFTFQGYLYFSSRKLLT